MLSTNEVVQQTGIGRVMLQYAIRWVGITPTQKTKHGRKMNFYTPAQVAKIVRAARNGDK